MVCRREFAIHCCRLSALHVSTRLYMGVGYEYLCGPASTLYDIVHNNPALPTAAERAPVVTTLCMLRKSSHYNSQATWRRYQEIQSNKGYI